MGQMRSGDSGESVEIDILERGLLSDSVSVTDDVGDGDGDSEVEDETVLYSASFEEMEENYVKYQTAQWVLYSLLLVLAWGIGLLMLLYIPVRRYISRKDFGSRKLYVTSNAIVYKVTRPVALPCFGVLKKEKHVLLASVADVVIEQGYLQSLFGIFSVRIENVGVRRPPSDDVQIHGISNPRTFRHVILTRLSEMRSEGLSRQVPTYEDPKFGFGHSPSAQARRNIGASLTSQPMSPSKSLGHDVGELILQKLDEVGGSVKRVENLMEGQHYRASELGLSREETKNVTN